MSSVGRLKLETKHKQHVDGSESDRERITACWNQRWEGKKLKKKSIELSIVKLNVLIKFIEEENKWF